MARAKITQAEFMHRVFKLHGNKYIVVGIYENIGLPIEIKHAECENIFTPRASDFLGNSNRKGTECPKCSHRSVSYTTEEFKKIVEDISDGEYEFVDDYTTTHSHKEFLHNACGKSFSMRPNNFLVKGNRYPKCKESKGEIAIAEWLVNNDITYIHQYRPGKALIGSNFISFDFAIKTDTGFILIEFDGRHHYEPFSVSQKSLEKFTERQRVDKLKNKYAVENQLWLIRIPYMELENVGEILDVLFNDYLLSESTLQTNGSGNIDPVKYIVNLQ